MARHAGVRPQAPQRWARTPLGIAVLLAAPLGIAVGLATGPWEESLSPWHAAPGPATRYSPFDFARMGNEAAWAWLRPLNGGRTVRVVEAARAAVVRFRVSGKVENTTGGRLRSYTLSNFGSGVLVNGGRHVLVAGHCLDLDEEVEDLRYEISPSDGTLLRGRVPAARGGRDGAPEGDWGLVELEGDPPPGCPALPFRAAAAGATVVALGYSGTMGVDDDGRVFDAQALLEAPLSALAFVGRLVDATTGQVEIVAGAPTSGGMSGGALIDLDGYVVGVHVNGEFEWSVGDVSGTRSSTRWFTDRAEITVAGKELEFTLGLTATPVAVFEEFVRSRAPR